MSHRGCHPKTLPLTLKVPRLFREVKMAKRHNFLGGTPIDPKPVTGSMTVAELVETSFLAYNAARLREACQLLSSECSRRCHGGHKADRRADSGGLGMSAIVPLIENGFVDWIVSTGAISITTPTSGSDCACTAAIRRFRMSSAGRGVVRIYDIFFEYEVLLSTDAFYRKMIEGPEFQRDMSSAEFHYLAGKYVAERERVLGLGRKSLLAAAFESGVPIYTSSPGDSSIGMNVAAKALTGNRLRIDVNSDVNETAAIVLDAKRTGGKSAVFILGGGSPKKFLLQTEPQIQEVLKIEEKGHDYFLQVTDARPDTGGLSGATPSEAVSWGKIDPDRLPDAVVCYVDSTIGLPILTSYALARHTPRKLKRLYERREAMMKLLVEAHERAVKEE
jgi:deoxyhypusine synthase